MTTHTIQEALDHLDHADGALTLDFSAVRRLEPGTVRSLQHLAGLADEKSVKVTLQGVNVDVYQVMKLVRLTPRFAFLQ